MDDVTYDPAAHYDRVTGAWTLLLGDDLHYGLFATGDEDLPTATQALTELMAEAAEIDPTVEVLDVGCGTGMPACYLASAFDARVVGITTSAVGVETAAARAVSAGVDHRVRFERRDGTDNGYPDASFDRVWVLESSHLMRERDRLVSECARVLRPGGRLALCDIMLRRELPFLEVRRLLRPLTLLRDVFGDAHMNDLGRYEAMAAEHGVVVDRAEDLTAATRATFDRWRDNAARHRVEVVAGLGDRGLEQFVEACDVLAGFWDDGTLGYGLVAATKPL